MAANICPGCSSEGTRQVSLPGIVYKCKGCGGFFGDCGYKGNLSQIVNTYAPMIANCDPEDMQYFDISFVSSDGPERVHGWMHRNTRHVVQYG